jgi:4-amino-4-deoxy-L-arabinose transferase-like glycosyltransferase
MFLVVSGLVQQGMFMDGIQYACISKNLAEGYSTFWFPLLSPFRCNNGAFYFLEHPPLFYFFESLFFRIPGAGNYAEKLFSAFMWICNAYLIHRLWKLIHGDRKDVYGFSWLPVLLWMITPVCFWCFHNNMIEILVSVFTLSSVCCMLKFLLQTDNRSWYWLILAAVLLYAGFLTKGLIALFPLCVFVVFLCTHKTISMKQALLYSLAIVFFFLVLFFSVYYLNPSANYSLSFYFKESLMSRIAKTPTVNNRFELLFDLGSQLLPVLGITLLVFFIQKVRKRIGGKGEAMKWFWFFLLLGCCGSLPIMLTMVQKGFYFMPSLAFFALGFAVLILRFFQTYRINPDSLLYKGFRIFSMFLAVASVIICPKLAGTYSRDEAVLKEVNELAIILQKENTINCDMDVYFTWNYQFYMQRYHRIYVDPTKTYRKFLLIKSEEQVTWLSRYELVKKFGSGFMLYKRK